MDQSTFALRGRGFFDLPREMRDRVYECLKITVRLSKPNVEYSKEPGLYLGKNLEDFATSTIERVVPHARLVSKQFQIEAAERVSKSIVLSYRFCLLNLSKFPPGQGGFLGTVTALHLLIEVFCNMIDTGQPCKFCCMAYSSLGRQQQRIESFVGSLCGMSESQLGEVHLHLYLQWPEKDEERFQWPHSPHLLEEERDWIAEEVKTFTDIRSLKTIEVRKYDRLKQLHMDDNQELWVRWDC